MARKDWPGRHQAVARRAKLKTCKNTARLRPRLSKAFGLNAGIMSRARNASKRFAAVELGFTSTVGIIHDGEGQLQPLGEHEREVYTAMRAGLYRP